VQPFFLFIYGSISFLLALLIFPVLIKLFRQWKVLDSPGLHKIHENFTPSMGGLPIVIGVAFSLLIAMPISELAQFKFFFIAMSLMFITGLRDDILILSPRQKMISQFLPIIILVVFGDTLLNSLYGLFPGIIILNKYAAIAITIITILILTNSYNLIDGLDGLAGSIGLISLTFLGTWFYGTENIQLALISFSFTGSILAFLIFNWQPSRIFMGDTGALTIGLLLSYLIIQFINLNYALPPDHFLKFEASVSTAVCVLIIPVFDTLRVIILRLRKFQSPLRADKNHLHHQLLKIGFSHSRSVIILGSVNLLFLTLAWVLRYEADTVILPVVAGLCLAINHGLRFTIKKRTKNEGKS
jgi:UDP-GlcNAc:undecaprenyl-phosphate/decaprenyl-phosphate GlcNAc-1-phosphate transferase